MSVLARFRSRLWSPPEELEIVLTKYATGQIGFQFQSFLGREATPEEIRRMLWTVFKGLSELQEFPRGRPAPVPLFPSSVHKEGVA